MFSPDQLFEEWLRQGPRAAAGPESLLAPRVLVLMMFGGAAACLLLLRWYVYALRRRDEQSIRRMQRILMAAIWAGFVVGMGGYFWYLSSLAGAP